MSAAVWGDPIEPDAEGPAIPDRQSDLAAFVQDVTARYPVVSIYLFGSRSGCGIARQQRPQSDWDVLVIVDGDPEPVVSDPTLQRHFGEFLDLFAGRRFGEWHFPPWTTCGGGMRGWFPESHPEIESSMRRIFPEPTA